MNAPQRHFPYFTKRGQSLGWQSLTGVAMLTGYFDESGEDDPDTGHLVNLTIGGSFASFEVWQNVSEQWKRALDQEGVKVFHMKHFEHYRGEFAWFLPDGTRDKARHNGFLNVLLDIICSQVKYHVGFGNVPVVNAPGKKFTEAYERGIVDALMHAGKESAFTFNEPVSLVFAIHKEFSEHKIQAYHRLINWEDARLASSTVGRPEYIYPLQVADLVAYELSRQQRPNAPDRYPMKRLRESAETCGVMWSGRQWP
jgi:hypothetical protein